MHLSLGLTNSGCGIFSVTGIGSKSEGTQARDLPPTTNRSTVIMIKIMCKMFKLGNCSVDLDHPPLDQIT